MNGGAVTIVYDGDGNRVKKIGWCGQPPASDAEIRLGEERLGVSLPPSYREFLKISNGWRPFSSFVERLYPLEDVEKFRIANPEYLEEIQKYYQEDDIAEHWSLGRRPLVPQEHAACRRPE